MVDYFQLMAVKGVAGFQRFAFLHDLEDDTLFWMLFLSPLLFPGLQCVQVILVGLGDFQLLDLPVEYAVVIKDMAPGGDLFMEIIDVAQE